MWKLAQPLFILSDKLDEAQSGETYLATYVNDELPGLQAQLSLFLVQELVHADTAEYFGYARVGAIYQGKNVSDEVDERIHLGPLAESLDEAQRVLRSMAEQLQVKFDWVDNVVVDRDYEAQATLAQRLESLSAQTGIPLLRDALGTMIENGSLSYAQFGELSDEQIVDSYQRFLAPALGLFGESLKLQASR